MSWINEYIYLVEKYAVKNKDKEIINFTNITNPKRLYIICYHVWNDTKYPFIQFMLEKEQDTMKLVLPFIEINSNTHNDINKLIIKKIGRNLENSIQNIWSDKNILYKGLINDSYEQIYALVDISSVNIRHMEYVASNLKASPSHIVFSLPSEIINFGSVYDIKISDNVKELFYDLPELGVLHEPHNKQPYPLPDAIYSGSFLQNVVYSSLFGPSKKYINAIGRTCYYFNVDFKTSYLDGGWVNEMFYTPDDVIDKKSSFKKYIKGGITRYALFPESFSVVELYDQKINITNDLLDTLNIFKQIYIVQRPKESDDIKVTILARDYNSFVPLSYCEINMQSIGDKYDDKKIEQYSLL